MRLIGTMTNPEDAERFCRYLAAQGLSHSLEINRNNDWSSETYGDIEAQIWVTREEDVGEAQGWLQFFLENPNDPRFTSSRPSLQRTPSTPPRQRGRKDLWMQKPLGPITLSLLVICVGLFMVGHLMTTSFLDGPTPKQVPFFASPIKRALMYDYPEAYSLASSLYEKYGIQAFQNPDTLPPAGKEIARKLTQTPVWQGVYPMIIQNRSLAFWEWSYPSTLFAKIREGQFWRLFTPDLLHADLFHLFFNMLWLFVLGKQMEQNLRWWAFIAFIVLVGVISNTAQYLVSGPNFLGFSGILCGMLTFIWTRQRIAPWENYQLQGVTIAMLIIFILGMFALQLVLFFGELLRLTTLSLGLANTAHVSGALMGLLLGRIPVFSWKTES